jgi:hypothetical protein
MPRLRQLDQSPIGKLITELVNANLRLDNRSLSAVAWQCPRLMLAEVHWEETPLQGAFGVTASEALGNFDSSAMLRETEV